MTNNPRKIAGLQGYGLSFGERVELEVPPTRHNVSYLRDKRDREGHILKSDALATVTPAPGGGGKAKT
jgi:3,4-dihydroxy 2-butanone 4-phosphate synthase/GTP cyclohydrolase II